MKKKVYYITKEQDEVVKRVAKKNKSTESKVIRDLIEKIK